jgi:hypothetical protein
VTINIDRNMSPNGYIYFIEFNLRGERYEGFVKKREGGVEGN